MAAVTKNLFADKGATFDLSVRYKQPDGTPVDLTGYTAVFSLLGRGEGALIDSKAGTVSADGWITVEVTDEETDTWPVGKSAYRLEIETPAGARHFLLVGLLDVRGV